MGDIRHYHNKYTKFAKGVHIKSNTRTPGNWIKTSTNANIIIGEKSYKS